jgi:hypothetical protein
MEIVGGFEQESCVAVGMVYFYWVIVFGAQWIKGENVRRCSA